MEREPVEGITIDNPDSKDLDDAIYLAKDGSGWMLHVSIADVDSGVPKGSDLDQEAYKRGFTRYFADGTNDPMLPGELSENKLSLLEGQQRNTVTVSVSLSGALEVGEYFIHRTQLTNRAKLSYESVDVILQQPQHQFHDMLKQSAVIAEQLLSHRREKGALVFWDISSGWAISEEGYVYKIEDEFHIAHLIIQELMILTNQLVAKYFIQRDVPVIFRHHKAGEEIQNRELVVNKLNKLLGQSEITVESAFAIQQQIGNVLPRATYGPELEGHYGLNLPAYLHFTSPIRRYADLVDQRILFALLKGEASPYSFEGCKYD